MEEIMTSLLQWNGTADIYLYIGVVLLVVIAIMLWGFFTIKKLVINLITAYLCIYALNVFFHIVIVPDALLLALMAFFGPLAVLVGIFFGY